MTIDRSDNGSGILAMDGARGSATLTGVTVTGSAEGDVLIEPGSQSVTNGAVAKRSPAPSSRPPAKREPRD